MKIELFDRYDIRTRILAFVFVVSPFLLDAYILVDSIRNFSSTVIVTVVLLAGCGLSTCWMRYLGNQMKQEDYIVEYLSDESTEINPETKDRYIRKLIECEPRFAEIRNIDPDVRRLAAEDISAWLREKTRDEKFPLVHEENLNYGFVRNLYAMKPTFIICFTVYNVLLLTLLILTNCNLSPKEYLASIPVEHVACAAIHIVVYLIWIFAVCADILNFTARKYARAALSAVDSL